MTRYGRHSTTRTFGILSWDFGKALPAIRRYSVRMNSRELMAFLAFATSCSWNLIMYISNGAMKYMKWKQSDILRQWQRVFARQCHTCLALKVSVNIYWSE